MTMIRLPPLTDLSVYLREPGFAHKASIVDTLALAAAHGVGRVVAQPETHPVTDSAQVIDAVRERAKAVADVELCVLGALTRGLDGEGLSEMAALKDAGVVGLSTAARPLPSLAVFKRALRYAASLQLTVHVQPIEASLSAGGIAHAGAVATRLGLPGIPVGAETCALAAIIELVHETGARVHVGRLSAARSVALIARAKAEGLPISADVAWRQLYDTDVELAGFDAQMHVVPPLRSGADRLALIDGVASGVIDAICSDHQPHERDAKLAPLPSTEPGRADLPGLLRQSLKLVSEGYVPLERMIDALSAAPNRILGLKPLDRPDLLVDLAAP
jgi:dihydroorotase